jgi:hypothetical protein
VVVTAASGGAATPEIGSSGATDAGRVEDQDGPSADPSVRADDAGDPEDDDEGADEDRAAAGAGAQRVGAEEDAGPEQAGPLSADAPAPADDSGASVDPAVQGFSMPSIMSVEDEDPDPLAESGGDGADEDVEDGRPWWRPSG